MKRMKQKGGLTMKGRRARLLTASAAHFFVDFACALYLFGGAPDPTVFLVYNYCAFALQLPLGILADRLDRNAALAAAGCALTAAASLLPGGLPLAAIAGLGNALFHVGAGVEMLCDSGDARKSLGIFVSPGALGLFAGGALCGALPRVSALPLLLLCAGAILYVARLFGHLQRSGNGRMQLTRTLRASLPAVSALVLVVLLRSFVGFTAAQPWKTGQALPLLAVLMVALGKCAGGILADALGARRVGTLSLLLAGALFLLPQSAPAGLAALFLFNMTMPLTLWGLSRLLPGGKGLAFGLTTFALFLGFVPVGVGAAGQVAPLWTAAICALSAALLFPALQREAPARQLARRAGALLPRRSR